MTAAPSPLQTPAPVRLRWRWRRIVLLLLLAGFAALGWNRYTWHRAVRQLEEAGITEDAPSEGLGERLRWAAQGDWHRFFKADTWRSELVQWRMNPAKAGKLRNLDALAPALRRINPELLVLSGCPVLENVNGLKGLPALVILDLSGCPALHDLNGLKGLSSLMNVSLQRCSKLQKEDVSALKAALPSASISFEFRSIFGF